MAPFDARTIGRRWPTFHCRLLIISGGRKWRRERHQRVKFLERRRAEYSGHGCFFSLVLFLARGMPVSNRRFEREFLDTITEPMTRSPYSATVMATAMRGGKPTQG